MCRYKHIKSYEQRQCIGRDIGVVGNRIKSRARNKRVLTGVTLRLINVPTASRSNAKSVLAAVD